MSRVKNMGNAQSASDAKSVSNLKISVLGLLVCLAASLASNVTHAMEYNNQGAQEAREWKLLANQISEGADADNSGQRLRAALSAENRKLLNEYSPSAVTQALSELAADQGALALIAARAQDAQLARTHAEDESKMAALERPVELKLLSLLAHKQKLATQAKEKEYMAAFKYAACGWGSVCLGVVVCVAAFITDAVRTPECPRAY